MEHMQQFSRPDQPHHPDHLRYRAWAEIDLTALARNVEIIRERLPQQTEIMAVVKANAYGHGDEAVCRTLWEQGVRWFAVSNLEEAQAVREYCPQAEIFILGYTPPEFAPELARDNIIQGVLSLEYALRLAECAKAPVRCHIKLDTGMGRIGFCGDSPEECADQMMPLFGLKQLAIEGIYTHFSVADSPEYEDVVYTDAQEQMILDTYDILAARGHRLTHLHFMNSAAAVSRPNPRATLARVGIVLYGLLPNYPIPISVDFYPVMSLYSVVSHVKVLDPGHWISYGRTYQTQSRRIIATVTIGYADGYSRLLSGRGYALVRGVECNIVGRVCMDQVMLDVTELAGAVRPGDKVTMIGVDGRCSITADQLAFVYNTIGYEVVCGISKRVPRIEVRS